MSKEPSEIKQEYLMAFLRIIAYGVIGYCIGYMLGSCTKAYAGVDDRYKIAIIDTGMSPVPFDMSFFKLCTDGHHDFTIDKAEVGADKIGHGSYVTSIINRRANTKNICFLIYKVIPSRDVNTIAKAIYKAYRQGAEVINISLGANYTTPYLEKVVKFVTTRGIKLFVSAGNENANLNEKCVLYPQCIKGVNSNMRLVGALDTYGEPASYSNYGLKIHVWKWGDIRRSRGTSFSAPRALGDYVRSLRIDKRK